MSNIPPIISEQNKITNGSKRIGHSKRFTPTQKYQNNPLIIGI